MVNSSFYNSKNSQASSIFYVVKNIQILWILKHFKWVSIVSFTTSVIFHWGRKACVQHQPWLYNKSLSPKFKSPPHTHLYSFMSVFPMLKTRVGDKVIVLKAHYHVNWNWLSFLEIYTDELFVQNYRCSVSGFDFTLPTLKGKLTATFRLKIMYGDGLYFLYHLQVKKK